MELPASWLLTAETQFFQAASQSATALSLYKAMVLSCYTRPSFWDCFCKAIILTELVRQDGAFCARIPWHSSCLSELALWTLPMSEVGWIFCHPDAPSCLQVEPGTRGRQLLLQLSTFAHPRSQSWPSIGPHLFLFHAPPATCPLQRVRPFFPLPTSALAGHEPWSGGWSLGTPRIQSGGLCLPTKRDQEFLERSCREAQCRHLLPHWQQWVMIKRSLVENYTLKLPTLWAPDLGAGFQNQEGSQYDKRKKYAIWNTQCLDYGLCVWTHQGRWNFRSGIEAIRHHRGQHRNSFWPSYCCSIICHEAIRHHRGQHRSFWPSDGTSNCRCIVAGVQLHLAWAKLLQRRKKAMDWQSCWVHGLKAILLWAYGVSLIKQFSAWKITVAHINSNNTMKWRQQAGWQFPTSKLARKETFFDTAARQVLDHRPKDFRFWSEAFPGVYFLGKRVLGPGLKSQQLRALIPWLLTWNHWMTLLLTNIKMVSNDTTLTSKEMPSRTWILALSKWMLLPSNAHGCGGRLQAVQPLPKQNWSMNDSTAYKCLSPYNEKNHAEGQSTTQFRPRYYDKSLKTAGQNWKNTVKSMSMWWFLLQLDDD